MGDDGKIGGVPAYVTNQVGDVLDEDDEATARIAILGDWSQVLLGVWSEIDILVNPFESTAYRRGGVLIRAMSTVDVAVRHPQAFVVASDIAL